MFPNLQPTNYFNKQTLGLKQKKGSARQILNINIYMNHLYFSKHLKSDLFAKLKFPLAN